MKFLNNYVVRLDKPTTYFINRQLGKGTYAIVHQAYKKKRNEDLTETKYNYAVKSLPKSIVTEKQIELSQLIAEISIQRKLFLCGNVVRIHRVYESGSQIHLILDY